jgi:hypothetical protein
MGSPSKRYTAEFDIRSARCAIVGDCNQVLSRALQRSWEAGGLLVAGEPQVRAAIEAVAFLTHKGCKTYTRNAIGHEGLQSKSGDPVSPCVWVSEGEPVRRIPVAAISRCS